MTFWKYQYAESLIEQHKYKQGFARLEEIIKEDSKSNYLNTYAWFLTTAQDINVRDYAKATHLAQIALEKSPNNAMIADTLACAYHAKGDKEKANELATKYKLDKRTEEFRLNMLCQSEGHEPINKSRDMASQKEPTGLSRK